MDSPLFVTDDPTLLDELQRLAAAAGVTALTRARRGATRCGRGPPRPWCWSASTPPGPLARIAPPRRAGVHVVGRGGVPDDVFRTALALGAENVAELPRLGRLADRAARRPRRRPARSGSVTLGVMGGSGGAGATTFACALGQMAARTGTAVVVDADPLGPGVDRVLGLDGDDGVRWDALCQTTGRLSAPVAARRVAPARRARRAHLVPRSARAAPGVRGARGDRRRPSAATTPWCSTCPARADPLVEEVVARCDRVLVVVGAHRRRARVRGPAVRRLPRPPRRAAGAARRRRRSRASRSRSPVSRCAARMADQRGLDEAIDLGLGPVRSRRGPLGRAGAGDARRPGGAAAGGMTVALPAERGAVVDEVRERLAREPGRAHRRTGWPRPCERPGGPVGDATVLAVHEALRRDVRRRRAARAAAPQARRHRRARQRDRAQVYVDRGDGLRAHRRHGSPTRAPYAGSPSGWPHSADAGSTTPRPYVDVRLADGTRCHAVLAPVARPGHADLAAGAAGPRLRPRRARGRRAR